MSALLSPLLRSITLHPYLSFTLLLLTPLFLLLLAILYDELTREPAKNLPPYPFGWRPLPLIGHMHKIPQDNMQKMMLFKEAHDKFGPVLTIYQGRRPKILVGDPRVALDLLDGKRAENSAERVGGLNQLYADWLIDRSELSFSPPTPHWRNARKVVGVFATRVSKDMTLPEMEGKVLIENLIKNQDEAGEEWFEELWRFNASLTTAMGYGRHLVDPKNDLGIKTIKAEIATYAEDYGLSIASIILLDNFPELDRFIPKWMMPAKGRVLGAREKLYEYARVLMGDVNEKMEKGTCAPCLGRDAMELRATTKGAARLRDIDYNDFPGALGRTGLVTPVVMYHTMVLAMMINPEIQAKVHEELDRVVGSERSPCWEDKESLPYTEAVIKESTRWRPAGPIIESTGHEMVKEDWVNVNGKDYHLPSGTILAGCTVALNACEDAWEDADKFNPDRYLDGSPQGANKIAGFGFGKRVCPGQVFVRQNFFVTCARLLWAFRFVPKTDPTTKKPILPDGSYENSYHYSHIIEVNKFPCHFVPRSQKIKEIALADGAEAWRWLEETGYMADLEEKTKKEIAKAGVV